MGLLDRVDILALLQREQYWIKKLKIIAPFGLNKRREISLPFHLLYNLLTKQLKLTNLLKPSMKNSDYKDLAPYSDINLCLHIKEIKTSKTCLYQYLKNNLPHSWACAIPFMTLLSMFRYILSKLSKCKHFLVTITTFSMPEISCKCVIWADSSLKRNCLSENSDINFSESEIPWIHSLQMLELKCFLLFFVWKLFRKEYMLMILGALVEICLNTIVISLTFKYIFRNEMKQITS